ncbi:response regulator transcription factor [Eubacterium sp. ER2]|uniref:response regulator transcription factor n=1 Tax=Eubacterium sp. ER2 TaxID=1519438 RepID=UPI00051CAA91|nr:response regulator transcription factor [Eubacterium sp. ER2]
MSLIAVIDDDEYIGDMLRRALEGEGYQVARAYSGTEALLLLEKTNPDLVLLDLMMPGLAGEEVLKRIQGIPVIVVSAKADVENKVDLLLGGAADYVTKPFDIRELLARIAVQLRQAESTGAGEDVQGQILVFEDLRMDTAAWKVWAGEELLHLTPTEFAILKQLMARPSQVITKARLLDAISLDTPDCTEGSLKIHISHLRRKLKRDTDCDYIEAVWGIGFKMRQGQEEC